MDKFFITFGKIILILLVVGGVGYATYTYGKTSVTPAPQTNLSQTTAAPTDTILATPTMQASQTVTAGLNHAQGILLPAYTVMVPTGWTTDHQQDLTGSPSDKLTITNGAYQITISQGAFGGGMCVYPGEPDQEGPESRYTSFTEFAGTGGSTYRRGLTASTTSMSVCQKTPPNTVFGNITSYGHISYSAPANPDAAILAQMDTIVSSLKIQ